MTIGTPAPTGLVLASYERPVGVNPPLDYPAYRSTALRAPRRPLQVLHQGLTMVTGRVLDSDGRAVPDTLIEIWQANAAGRYRHGADQHPAPLDPNFTGAGRCMTDSGGRYRFVTIKPGAYPWQNHPNAWRAQHIHFSLFGRAFTQRLVTQMFFPGDPLFAQDPIFNSAPEPARERMISRFRLDLTEPDWALAYEWDIVLRGRGAAVFEAEEGA